MSLSLRRLYRLRPSLLLDLSAPLAASFYRLLSTVTTQAPSPNANFAVDYLTQSCGLPSHDARRASKLIQHLKSADKPDAVLRFLKQTGITESNLRTALSRDPRLLCSSVENILRPNITKLQEVGLSMEDISGIISLRPGLFQFNMVSKIDFWMRALGSVENVTFLLTRRPSVLSSNLEKVIKPNLSFLQEQCGLSVCQIVYIIKMSFRLIQCGPEILKMKAKRAEELGIACGSPKFKRALVVVGCLRQSTIDAKLLFLKSFGLSQEEVNTLIRNDPHSLMHSEESIGRKMEFLMKEAGCDKSDVVRVPALLGYSLEKRLIPRNLVRKLLVSVRLPVANYAFVSFMLPSEQRFVEKFVLPYEHAIPGLHRAYAEACTGKFGAIEQTKSISI